MSTTYKSTKRSCVSTWMTLFSQVTHRMFDDFEKAIMKEFQLTDIGEILYFLGVEASKSEKSIFIS